MVKRYVNLLALLLVLASAITHAQVLSLNGTVRDEARIGLPILPLY